MTEPTTPEPTRRRRWPWIVGGVVVLLAAIGSLGDDEEPTVEATDTTTVESTVTSTTTTTEPPTTTTEATTTTTAPTTTTTGVDPEQTVENLRLALIDVVEESNMMERVEVLTFGDGELVIEGRTPWASEDSQAPEQVRLIETLAALVQGLDESARVLAFDSLAPQVTISTTSTDGDYAITTVTEWDQLIAITERRLSLDDWLASARQ